MHWFSSGADNLLKYGLIYNTHGYTDDYKPDIDPSVLNSHATAAFRYFHSNIQGKLECVYITEVTKVLLVNFATAY